MTFTPSDRLRIQEVVKVEMHRTDPHTGKEEILTQYLPKPKAMIFIDHFRQARKAKA